MAAPSSILELASDVQRITHEIVDHINSLGSEHPTLDASSPLVPQTPQYASLRASLNDAANDLIRLVNGPKTHFQSFVCEHTDLAVMQTALELDFFAKVPTDSTISLTSLSEKCGVDEDRIGRIMRFLVTLRIFREPEPDVFGHTAQSILFVNEPGLYAAAHYQLDEFFKAASDTADCLINSPKHSDQNHSPFSTKFGVPLFQYYKEHPKAAARFAQAMAGIVKLDRQVLGLKEDYPWHNLSGKVVDVGGGSGHVSIFLAQQFPKLDFVVEDGSPDMLAQGRALDLSDLDGRVQFMQHDFFKPQPIGGASAYLIRQVLHNWNDQDCITILRCLVPALEKSAPETPLLINDTLLPEPGSVSRYEEHNLRQMDIMMMIALGAKQRSERDFKDLLAKADPRLQVIKVHGNAAMGLLEVHLVR